MTDTFNVGLVTPSQSIVFPFDTFILRWRFDGTAMAIRDGNDEITSLTLPLTEAKTNDDPAWNEPFPDARFSHHILVGVNGLIEKHSIIVNSSFDDTGFPYLLVWDWINSIVYGPLQLDDAVKQIEGPILIGSELWFIAVDAVTFKPQLYRTNANLEDPTAPGEVGAEAIGLPGATIPTDRSIEHMMASNQFLSVWETPAGGSGPVILAHVWDRGSTGAPSTTANVNGGFISYNGVRDKLPGVKLATGNSFFIRSRTPYETTTISLTEVTSTSLFNTGDWGTFIFPQERCYFTILSDDVTARLTYTGSPPDFLQIARTWKTGTIVDVETTFEIASEVPAGWNSVLMPFE